MLAPLTRTALASLLLLSCADTRINAPPPAHPQFSLTTAALPAVRISEIHYDNTGTDAAEAVEISGPAGTSLAGWTLVLYNGANGAVYDTDALSGTIPATCDPRGVVVLNYPVNGIQNGSPDGVALVDATGTVIEFLSYEGTFVAVGGPAGGMTSTDIGASEAGTEPLGQSLQRDGAGTWSGPKAATFGACNDADEPPPPPPPPALPDVRFTELHYDNDGVDIAEAIEIEGPTGQDLTGWRVILYNGSTGLAYDSRTLAGTLVARCDGGGRGVTVLSYPSNGIQNGSPDGLALIDPAGTVIEFLSYEGPFSATDGPAAGVTSTDIGQSEAPATPLGRSLQRLATGTWQAPQPATFGACNEGDTGPPPPPITTIIFSGRTASDPPLPVGFQDQVFATLVDATRTAIPTTFTWTSDGPAAAIDQDGVFTALAAGTALLRTTATDGASSTMSLPTRIASASTTAVYGNHAEFGAPGDANPADDIIVTRDQYTASYNATRGTPNWVSYNLEATHFGAEDRCDCFTFDPALTGVASYTTAAYTGSGAFHGFGIDRGHLARSFDRTSASLDNATTFYFTNIIPQAADLNQGPWAALESHLGDLARLHNKEVYIVTGPAGSKGTLKDQGLITIPRSVWKVALILQRDSGLAQVDSPDDFEVIAVIMPNDPGTREVPWETYRTTVDAVEALSGYDLLSLLPDQIEVSVESGLAQAMDLIAQLVADGRLPRGNAMSLTAKLQAAVGQLVRGDGNAARGTLESFLAELEALVRAGRLAPEDAAALEEWVSISPSVDRR